MLTIVEPFGFLRFYVVMVVVVNASHMELMEKVKRLPRQCEIDSPCQRLQLSEEPFQIMIRNICMTAFFVCFYLSLATDSHQYQM